MIPFSLPLIFGLGLTVAALPVPPAHAEIAPPGSDQAGRDQAVSGAGARAENSSNEKRDKAAEKADLRITGRVFARNTITRPNWNNQLSVDSARMAAKYRHKSLGLAIEVDVEMAGGRAEIRDAYVQLSPIRAVRVQAGRFKRPISAVAMASKWDLPVLERGIVSDLELPNETSSDSDRLPLGGRADGVTVRLRGRHLPLDPRLVVGVFGSEAFGGQGSPITVDEPFPEDIYSRFEIAPVKGVRLSTSLGWFSRFSQLQSSTRDTFSHGFVGGVDAVIEKVIEPGLVRVWLEGYAGTSPFHFGTDLSSGGTFVAVRAIAAWRFTLTRSLPGPDSPGKRLLYLEPHIAAQALDGSSDVSDDSASEFGAGINVGFARSWRVQLGASHITADNRFPGGRTDFIAQLGARFY